MCVTQHDRKKLLSLALLSLLSVDGADALLLGQGQGDDGERIFGVMSAVTEVLNDITREDDDTGAIIE